MAEEEKKEKRKPKHHVLDVHDAVIDARTLFGPGPPRFVEKKREEEADGPNETKGTA